jgi:hypothetical protein
VRPGIRLTPRGCWVTGRKGFPNGYIPLRVNDRAYMLHRVAFMAFKGAIPAGLQVCHRCDNPPCCNPRHLFIGTPKENALDQAAKDRPKRGRASSRLGRRLAPDEVRAIRASGERQGVLAIQYGVTLQTISLIKRGVTWGHVR